MIPAEFAYVRASSVEEAISVLGEHGDDAELLAGGHSLLPLMKLRLAFPEVVVDLGRIRSLTGVRETGDGRLSIGAMTRHQDVIDDELVRRHCGVLAEVTSHVGDPQVRHVGTIGGALAHGDAAGDLPAALLALEGSLTAEGPGGRREIAAGEFFIDYLTTALEPDEVLVDVRVPKLGSDWVWRYEKFQRVAQSWAIVGVLAVLRRADDHLEDVRVGLTNMATVPLRASGVERALEGAARDAIPDAARLAADGSSAGSDLHADRAYREHLARILTERALATALR